MSYPIPASLQPFICPTFSAIRTHQETVTALFWVLPTQQALPAVDAYLLGQTRAWLRDYFTGYFRAVDFPLAPEGTPFQHRLWQQVAQIPPGQTVTYGDLAQRLHSSPRAVGRGMGANPLPLLIPCHRVVAAQGMGGFSAPGDVDTKQWLLFWEKLHTQRNRSVPPGRGGDKKILLLFLKVFSHSPLRGE